MRPRSLKFWSRQTHALLVTATSDFLSLFLAPGGKHCVTFRCLRCCGSKLVPESRTKNTAPGSVAWGALRCGAPLVVCSKLSERSLQTKCDAWFQKPGGPHYPCIGRQQGFPKNLVPIGKYKCRRGASFVGKRFGMASEAREQKSFQQPSSTFQTTCKSVRFPCRQGRASLKL